MWQQWEPVLKWALASLQQHTNPQVRAGQQSSSLKYSQSNKEHPKSQQGYLGSDAACTKFPNLWILIVWTTPFWAQFYIKTYIVQHCYVDFGFVTTRQGDSLGQKLCCFSSLFFHLEMPNTLGSYSPTFSKFTNALGFKKKRILWVYVFSQGPAF